VPHAPRPTRFGRLHVAEPYSSLTRRTVPRAVPALQPVAHNLILPVLDQEDLEAQGIDTASLVPGAPAVDALGSCVANATTVALRWLLEALSASSSARLLSGLGGLLGFDLDNGNAVVGECFAIRLYHALTDQTGDPSTEWPPTDCGSSGLAACQWLEANRLIPGHKIAASAEEILTLMQDSPLIVGQPWLNAWMDPDEDGFIDGDGSIAQLETGIQGGVVGGHETCWREIEHIGLTAGGVDPYTTIIRFRNSWGESWGLAGEGRAHLSTFIALGKYCDFRAIPPWGTS
jgi:hypothetical protein